MRKKQCQLSPRARHPSHPVRMLLAFLLGAISLLSTHLHLGVLGKTALEKNRGRLLNPIQVVNFPQDACVVNVGGLDTTGVCLSGSECNARDGIIIGQLFTNLKLCDDTISTLQAVVLKDLERAAQSWWTTAPAATSRRT